MTFFRNLSIKLKLALIMAFMAVMMLGGGGIGLGGIMLANDALESTYRNRLEPTRMIGRIMLLMNNNRAQIMLALQHKPDNPFARMHDHPLEMHTDAIVKNAEEITALVAEHKRRDLSAEEKALAEAYAVSRARFVDEGLVPARAAMLAGQFDEANLILLKKINPLYRETMADAEALLAKTLETAKADYEAAQARYQLIRNVAIGGTLLGILLAALATVLLLRSIVQPLNTAVAHFRNIAGGDLTGKIEVHSRDEVGEVMAALAAMQQQMKAMIGQVVLASSYIHENAALLDRSVQDIVSQSGTQLDRAQEVATAMEEVSQSVTEVAGSAETTAHAATTSQQVVRTSIAQMARSIDATNRVVSAVQDSSGTITDLSRAIERIDSVTRTIKDIAEQTNLLALNAAIEAARAGEQGRGFAVVADEVRKLAERTAVSTTDISRMVSEIQKTTEHAVSSMGTAVHEVEQGIALMKASGQSLDQITVSSDEVSDMAQHIAAAAKQQSAASENVANNMAQISTLIEDNTHTARTAAEATASLNKTAQTLQSVVSRFRVGG